MIRVATKSDEELVRRSLGFRLGNAEVGGALITDKDITIIDDANPNIFGRIHFEPSDRAYYAAHMWIPNTAESIVAFMDAFAAELIRRNHGAVPVRWNYANNVFETKGDAAIKPRKLSETRREFTANEYIKLRKQR